MDDFDQDAPEQPLPTTWKTRDGRVLPIVEMTDQHLRNTIKYLRRRAPAINMAETLEMLSGPEPSGEMAQLAFYQELDSLLDMADEEALEGQPIYCALVEEAERRGLSMLVDGTESP